VTFDEAFYGARFSVLCRHSCRHWPDVDTNVDAAEEDEIRTRYDGLVAEARLAQAGGDVRRFAQGR
jgi:hypothetical protein